MRFYFKFFYHFKCFCKSDTLLQQLEDSIAKDKAVVDYIHKIDTKLYAQCAFSLPWMGKVTSNLTEQANSSLLSIREYIAFNLIRELWFISKPNSQNGLLRHKIHKMLS